MPTVRKPDSGGDSDAVVILSRLHVRLGDRVEADQVVFEIETDIITMEVRAPHAGTVVAEFFHEGDRIPFNAEVIRIDPA